MKKVLFYIVAVVVLVGGYMLLEKIYEEDVEACSKTYSESYCRVKMAD